MISHSHRTLFVHLPKCGGQSVELAFLNDLGLSWENRAPLLLRPKMDGENAPPRLAHLRLNEYVENHYISAELFDGYFKFAVVRCPYRRSVSFYTYFGLVGKKSLDAFVQQDLPALLKPTHLMYWFFRPQNDYIKQASGDEIGVDALYPLETLAAEWPEIAKCAGMPGATLPHINKSKETGVSASSLSQTSRAIIRELYAADFAAFPQYDTPVTNA